MNKIQNPPAIGECDESSCALSWTALRQQAERCPGQRGSALTRTATNQAERCPGQALKKVFEMYTGHRLNHKLRKYLR